MSCLVFDGMRHIVQFNVCLIVLEYQPYFQGSYSFTSLKPFVVVGLYVPAFDLI